MFKAPCIHSLWYTPFFPSQNPSTPLILINANTKTKLWTYLFFSAGGGSLRPDHSISRHVNAV